MCRCYVLCACSVSHNKELLFTYSMTRLNNMLLWIACIKQLPSSLHAPIAWMGTVNNKTRMFCDSFPSGAVHSLNRPGMV